MSNRNLGESPRHRKPKVSLAMTISQGLGGPKVNPKGVADGQPVNIPAPPLKPKRRRRVGTERVIGFSSLCFGMREVLVSAETTQCKTFPRKFLEEYFSGVRTINRHR